MSSTYLYQSLGLDGAVSSATSSNVEFGFHSRNWRAQWHPLTFPQQCMAIQCWDFHTILHFCSADDWSIQSKHWQGFL